MRRLSKACYSLLGILFIAATACHNYVPGPGPRVSGHIQTAYALRWVDIVKGTGALAESGRTLRVQYTGWLPNGKKFDSSYDRNTPFSFQLGAGHVIRGWDTGFTGMRVGGKRRLLIPYQLGYGDKDHNAIPAKSDLTFDIELLSVE